MKATSNTNIIDNPGLSFIGMTQPKPFIPLYRQMTEEEDGLLDRVLICQAAPERKKSGARSDVIEALHREKVKDFRLAFHSIDFF